MAFLRSAQVHRWGGETSGIAVQQFDVKSSKRESLFVSSFSHYAGCSNSSVLDRNLWGVRQGVESCVESRAQAIRCAVSKQKKKVKDKKRSTGPGEKQWKFDELMLVWDDAFQKFSDDASVATPLFHLARDGWSQYGRGCVLMEESVKTKPRGAASGFSIKSRYSSSDSPELPFYISSGWKAVYVPLDFINDPFKAPPESSSVEGEAVKVVDQAKLLAVLRGMDRTRLQGLLTEPSSTTGGSEVPEDAGGEEPYDPSEDELVVMFALSVDGQQAVGADVLKAYLTADDHGEALWTFQLRDGDGSDLIP